MDSVTQATLGAAVSVAVMGRRTAVWKAAVWGAVAGTLPDLDVLIDHGDPVANMTRHRAESHALFWLTLASAPLAALVARASGEWVLWRRWWLAVWLALITHPLLDAMTVYGTQLLLPFTDRPFGQGSVFIIDPLFTLPLLIGVVAALRAGPEPPARQRALRVNRIGLIVGSAYLAWSMLAQAWVRVQAESALDDAGVSPDVLLVTPAPFSTLLWRVVAVDAHTDRFHEGFRSLLDGGAAWHFDAFDRRDALGGGFESSAELQRMRWFTGGLYKLEAGPDPSRIVLSDLRMGQEPFYVFAFELVRPDPSGASRTPPRAVGSRADLERALNWLGPRTLGVPLPPPR